MGDVENQTSTKKSSQAASGSNKNKWIGLLVFVALAGGTAGGIAGGLSSQGGMVKGTWLTNWGTYITINDHSWYSVSAWGKGVSPIIKLTNSYAITQNAADAAYNPSKFSKHEYHSTDNGWAFCSSVYDADTAAIAEETDTTATYDATAATGGCNGFDHTLVSAYPMPIAGKWLDNWGISLEVTADTWSTTSGDPPVTTSMAIEAYGSNYLLYQNPADATYNPSKWTKVEFHTVGSGFGYCMSVYDGASATAALTTNAAYNASDATSGCSGFGHSVASPA
jgi:hypothetical protein